MAPYYQDATITLWHGDCLDVLRTLPDNSVDSVITDPPYGLEFMGAKWDSPWQRGDDINADAGFKGGGIDATRKLPSFTGSTNPKCADCKGTRRGRRDGTAKVAVCLCPDGGRFPNVRAIEMRAFQAWCQEWATECLRVLKPGGHLVAFGGTRTGHRLTCAIEDAGFEIRDSIAWVYGCLSDDTEILTSNGWVRYDKATTRQHALAFDTATGDLEWQPIQHVHRYRHDGEMVRLHSEHTDQLLTPNHRVVLEETGAEAKAPYVPSDEDLHHLLDRVPSPRPLPVGTETDLLTDVRWTPNLGIQEGQDQAPGRAEGSRGELRDLREGCVEARCVAETDGGGVLLLPVQRDPARGGVERARTQRPRGMDGRESGVVHREDDGSEEPRMEGRRYRVQEARELCRGAVRESAGVGAADGPQGRLHHGAPATNGGAVRLPDDAAGSRQPREPRSEGQPAGELDAVAVEPGAQALRVGQDRGRRLLPSTPVDAEVVDYAGVVWCITVPHGAFIARRNGLIFATGNSGFPKSLDVGKAIDKAAGATGTYGEPKTAAHAGWIERGRMRGNDGENGWQRPWMTDEVSVDNAARKYVPATDAARQWDGHGTSLKPAHEPVTVARKPLQGNVAQNVLTWGTGALNINAGRIGSDEKIAAHHGTQNPRTAMGDGWHDGYTPGDAGKIIHTSGRWPANVAFDGHTATTLDQQSGESVSGGGVKDGSLNGFMEGRASRRSSGQTYESSTGGASRFFFVSRDDPDPAPPFIYTAKAASSERPRVPGNGEGWVTGLGGKVRQCNVCGTRAIASGATELSCGHTDHRWVDNPRTEHTAHPTVKPLDLMRWLARLFTPPGGTILEPFAGSGTTVEAAILEGFPCIAIEKEAEYLPLVELRIARQRDPVRAIELTGEDPGLFGTLDFGEASA